MSCCQRPVHSHLWQLFHLCSPCQPYPCLQYPWQLVLWEDWQIISLCLIFHQRQTHHLMVMENLKMVRLVTWQTPLNIPNKLLCITLQGQSWSYGSWIYNYLCNQCLSPLMLGVQIPFWRGVLVITLCGKVCQWLTAGQWFSPDAPVSSTNKTNWPPQYNWNIVETP